MQLLISVPLSLCDFSCSIFTYREFSSVIILFLLGSSYNTLFSLNILASLEQFSFTYPFKAADQVN